MQIVFSSNAVSFVSFTEHLPYNTPGDWINNASNQTFLGFSFSGSSWLAPTNEVKILTWTMDNSNSLSSVNLSPSSVIVPPSGGGPEYTVTYILQP